MAVIRPLASSRKVVRPLREGAGPIEVQAIGSSEIAARSWALTIWLFATNRSQVATIQNERLERGLEHGALLDWRQHRNPQRANGLLFSSRWSRCDIAALTCDIARLPLISIDMPPRK